MATARSCDAWRRRAPPPPELICAAGSTDDDGDCKGAVLTVLSCGVWSSVGWSHAGRGGPEGATHGHGRERRGVSSLAATTL